MNYNRYLLLILIILIVDLIECIPTSNKKQRSTSPLEQTITEKGLMNHLEELQKIADDNGNTRLVGTKGHELTINYIVSSLESAGYHPQVQKIDFDRFDIVESTLNITNTKNQQSPFKATLINGSPSTPEEGISGQLISVGDACDSFDFSTLTKLQQPWIALVKDGKCSLLEKAKQAQNYGAHAILFYDHSSDEHFKTEIPAGTISKKTAATLLDRMQHSSPIYAKVAMVSNIVPVTTFNIIADTRNGNKSNVVMMGVHSDSVGEGPGINDNGSGTVAALEIATHINKRDLINAVRFCWWTGEEEGFQGSLAYMKKLTQQEKQNIALYLNADMIGSPNYVNMVYDGNESQAPPGLKPAPRGSLSIQKAFERYFEGIGQAHQLISLAVTEKQSDAYPFYNATIPTGGVSTGFVDIKTEAEQKAYGGQVGVAHDPCYHESCDTLKNINPIGLLIHSRAYAHLIEIYSQSTASLFT